MKDELRGLEEAREAEVRRGEALDAERETARTDAANIRAQAEQQKTSEGKRPLSL